jgi:putative nucleotidyltransferase with HDIG domain
MSYVPSRRFRPHRSNGLALPPGHFARLMETVRRSDVLVRIGLCIAAALAMWLFTKAWAPAFPYRTGYVPPRDIIARVDFEVLDQQETAHLRKQARESAENVYTLDLGPLHQLRQELTNELLRISQADAATDVHPTDWSKFDPISVPEADPELPSRRLRALKKFFDNGMDLAKLESAISDALKPLERSGILDANEPPQKKGSQTTILIKPAGAPPDAEPHRAAVDELRLAKLRPGITTRLQDALAAQMGQGDEGKIVGEMMINWLDKNLSNIKLLTRDEVASEAEAERAASAVPPFMRHYKAGDDQLAAGGQPIDATAYALLQEEHKKWLSERHWTNRLRYSLATFGLYLAVYVLCGFYIFHRNRRLLIDLRRFAILLGAIVATVCMCWMASGDRFRAEIIPLMLFGMTAAIAYEKELALLLSASVALIIAFALQHGLAEFVILVSGIAAAILLLRRIRSRTKLIYVGAVAGAVVMATAIGVGTLEGQTYGANFAVSLSDNYINEWFGQSFYVTLVVGAAWFAFCAVVAGILMTGLLPFVERLFDVQTDISLLELGDVQHPLLQQLVRRAPGTYNHSINVASIAETAAESIGANGLLVRVGAYFHDIGKMLKPSYFVENQGPDGNRHESLQPAMSTLVIIAHVKDGADLARQHHLPQSIIDFIEQHHGTTLVEYFYRREAKRLEAFPDSGELDESTFRYPGPQPQTKEAAVLMLADVVESASRALVDPTPSRIESLVHDLAMKRLLDGQFDECGLTLSELRTIEDSLVKSLTAVYHGRVKYPEHQTA